MKILNIYSTKYDIDLDNGFIYTKDDITSNNITSNIENNVSITLSNSELTIKYNNVFIMNLAIVSVTSSGYKVNYDKNYIYTGLDNNLDIIKKNVNITNGNVSINDGKLQLKYNSIVVDEFTLYYISSSAYKIDNNTIYIKGSTDYEKFVNNISFNGLSYNIYNTSNNVVSSGSVDDNFTIKILKDSVELDTYTIKTEYLEINNLSVKEDSKIIYNIIIGTTVADLIKNIDTSGTIEIKDKSGNILEATSILKTSSVVSIKLSTETIEYKISVLGDLNGNGVVDAGDIAKVYQNVKGINTFDDVDVLSGDVKNDDEILINDVTKLYQYLKGKITSLS